MELKFIILKLYKNIVLVIYFHILKIIQYVKNVKSLINVKKVINKKKMELIIKKENYV